MGEREGGGRGSGAWGRLLPALGLGAAGLAFLSGAPGANAAEPARLQLQPCHLEGLAEPVRCGVLEVLEDRSRPEGRRLPIHVAVVPALQRRPEPDPFVLLAGGPGQGGIGLAPWVATVFRKVRAHREIVLVDLRGTGRSHPLTCGSRGAAWSLLLSPAAWAQELAGCAARLDADPRLYAGRDAMEDLDEVRAALGYDRLNLWGGSYGTRAALVYLRLHPDRVRSVVLDGAAPFALRFPLHAAQDAQRALDLLLARCQSDPDCSRAHPDPRRALLELKLRLAAGPVRTQVRHPATGRPVTVAITWDLLASALRGALYVPQQAVMVPWMIARASSGDFEPLLAVSLAVSGWSVDTMSLGVTLAVLCTEDLPRTSAAEARRLAEGTFVGTGQYDFWARACRGWPVMPLPDRLDAPRSFGAPALVLSGALDPVAPPRWGEAAAAEFASARHVVVPGAAHNTTPSGCVPDLIDAFLRAGSAEELDASCVEAIAPLPFFLGPGREELRETRP